MPGLGIGIGIDGSGVPGVPGFVPTAMLSNPPDVYLNFKTNQAWIKSLNATVSASSLLSVTRATPATQVDSLGNWSQVASGTPALSDLGLSIWEARTNSIRNSTLAGAVAGSPGTLPTNWNVASVPAGLTRTLSILTINGVNVLAINFAGTTTSASVINIQAEASASQIAASYGQTWTSSGFVANAVSDPNVTSLSLSLVGTNGATQTESFASANLVSQSSLARVSVNGTLAAATTTNVVQRLITNSIASGVTVNWTVYLGWPQLENNSLINSTVASATTAANGTGTYAVNDILTVVGGTGTAATLKVTAVSGGQPTAYAVQSAGNYTAFPPSPASTTGGGGTGVTVNLTPTNLAANAVASPPILTSGVAATRNNDIESLVMTNMPAIGAARSVYGRATFASPMTYSQLQGIVTPNNGNNNRDTFFRSNVTGILSYAEISNSTNLGGASGAAISTGVSSKMMMAVESGDQAICLNGGALGTSSLASPASGLTGVWFGNNNGSTSFLNGNLEEAAVWFSQRVPNTQLQSMTT